MAILETIVAIGTTAYKGISADIAEKKRIKAEEEYIKELDKQMSTAYVQNIFTKSQEMSAKIREIKKQAEAIKDYKETQDDKLQRTSTPDTKVSFFKNYWWLFPVILIPLYCLIRKQQGKNPCFKFR